MIQQCIYFTDIYLLVICMFFGLFYFVFMCIAFLWRDNGTQGRAVVSHWRFTLCTES